MFMVQSKISVVCDQCLELLLVLEDVTHTSKGFEAKPYSICEAHSPGPEHKNKRIIFVH